MRYLISAQKQLFKGVDDAYIECSVEFCLNYFENHKFIGCDTETKGFDPYTKELLLVQLGDYENQFAIDTTSIDIRLFKDLFEDRAKTFIFHNAKFDLRFFLHKRIVIKNVWDTFLAESLLWLGYPPGMHARGLDSCCRNYLGVELDKSIRGQIIWRGLTSQVIVYGCNDVKYLIPLRNAQIEKLEEQDLITAIKVENDFVPVLAYIEYCGVKVDPIKWKKKLEGDLARLELARTELDTWVINHEDNRFIEKVIQGDLFNPSIGGITCGIKWSRPKQVVALFESLGFNLTVEDKKTKKVTKSVDAKIIKSQKHLSDIVPIYLRYKAAEKVVSTYGKSFLDSINPISHRIHTQFNQLMDTGRLSSGGGKDKDSGRKLPNLQNLPKNPETRACFVAEEGNLWISADYKSQESVIIANITQDKAMIEFFQAGKGDIHSLAAKMAFPKELMDIPLEEVEAKDPHTRDLGKKVEFAINYGGNGITIATNLGIPRPEGIKVYEDYMKGFIGLKAYQDFCRKDVMQKGYILLSPITGHRAHIYDYERLLEMRETMQQPGFWDAYFNDKEQELYTNRVRLVDHFNRRKSVSEKQSINYRIQGCGALMFKIASIKFYNYLITHNLLFKVKYVIPVHDEINLECPEEIAPKIKEILLKCMKEAGDIFCKIVRIGVDCNVATHWVH